jgi:ankyrin repeat protein
MNTNEKLLFKASETGNMALAAKALKPVLFFKHIDINIKNEFGDSPLMLAAIKGYRAVIEYFICFHASINDKNHYGDTALILASKHGHKSVAALLLANGAEVNATNNDGDSALLFALKNNDNSLAELLITNGADVTVKNGLPLLLALETSSNATINGIINAGASINVHDTNGDTPLILAIVWHNYEIAKLLITKNADVNAINNFGTTALVQAVRNNNLELVSLLIDSGADVNVNNGSALMNAIENGYKSITEMLIRRGSKITTNHGAALIQTYTNGHKDMAKILIDNTMDAAHRGAALFGALEQGNRALADLRIAAAATDNAMTKNSTLALIHALQQGQKELAVILSLRSSNNEIAEEPPKNNIEHTNLNHAPRLTDFMLLLLYDNMAVRDKACDLLCLFSQKHDTFQRHIEKRMANNPKGELTVFGIRRTVSSLYYIVMQNPENGFGGSLENSMLRDNDCLAQKSLVLTFQEILGFSTSKIIKTY